MKTNKSEMMQEYRLNLFAANFQEQPPGWNGSWLNDSWWIALDSQESMKKDNWQAVREENEDSYVAKWSSIFNFKFIPIDENGNITSCTDWLNSYWVKKEAC